MIKSKFFLTVFFLAAHIVLMSGVSFAQSAPFEKGEKICYNVKQMAIKAGTATLEFKGDSYLEGKKYTLILFRAQGFNFYDEERIYVDSVTFLPERVMRDLNIFGNKEQIMEEYFHKDGYVRITKTLHDKTTVQELQTKGAVDNIYGFIYRYRLQGKSNADGSFDLQLPTLRLKVRPVETVSFNAAGKKYKALLMKSVPEKYSIWFDTGDKRLPLRIGGAVGIANTVMTMVECDK